MAWCSVKAQELLYFTATLYSVLYMKEENILNFMNIMLWK